MKKFTLFTLAALFVATLSFFMVACQKEEVKTTTVENPALFKGVSFNNDVLVFEDEAAIQMFFSDYNVGKETTIEKLKKQFPNFESNYDAYEKLMQSIDLEQVNESTFRSYPNLVSTVVEGSDKYLTPTISNSLTYLANVKGFFQVGKTLYQITRNEMIEFDATTLKKQKVNKIEREEQIVDERGLDESLPFDACGGKRKLRGKIYKDNLGVFSETGAWTECTRRNNFGFWVTTDCQTLSHNGTVVEYRRDLLKGLCSVTGFSVVGFESPSDGRVASKANTCWGCCSQLTLAGPVSHSVTICGTSKSLITDF